jgi:hypothetical protein
MELMLRKFRLPKIKNCLLEEYNQKALLGVSLFCFGSDASVWGLRISLLSFGFLYLISALLLVICPITLNFQSSKKYQKALDGIDVAKISFGIAKIKHCWLALWRNSTIRKLLKTNCRLEISKSSWWNWCCENFVYQK